MRKVIRTIPDLGNILFASRYNQLLRIKEYTDKVFPKFPMELEVDANGEFQILPAFKSVFDVAYYALAQYVSASPNYPLNWGGKTGIRYCRACGNIFIKNGNRQIYCKDLDCKHERERRKSNAYYHRKIQMEKEAEWV